MEGHAWGGSVKVPLLFDMEIYVRLRRHGERDREPVCLANHDITNRFVPSEVLFDVLHKAILSTIRCRAYRIVKPQIVSEQIALAAVTPRRPYGTIPEEHIISAIKKNDVQHQAGADPIPRQTFIAQYPKSLAVETRHATRSALPARQ